MFARVSAINQLLVVTAMLEAGAGLVLVVAPAPPASLLLGVTLETPGGLFMARVCGIALLSLGLACWLAREDDRSRAARGLIVAMLLYNMALVFALINACLTMNLFVFGTAAAIGLHLAMALWCVVCLRRATTTTTVNSAHRCSDNVGR